MYNLIKEIYEVSISHIGMEQQHLVAENHYNTYILICQYKKAKKFMIL